MDINLNIIDKFADIINISQVGDDLQKVTGIAILVLAVLWILIIIGVAKNISYRTNNIGIQILCILIATLGGPLGLLIYRVIRPEKKTPNSQCSETALLTRDYFNGLFCSQCQTSNSENNNYCTHCGSALKVSCKECGTMISTSFEYCGNCGVPNL